MIPIGAWMKPVISSRAHMCVVEEFVPISIYPIDPIRRGSDGRPGNGERNGGKGRYLWRSRCGKVFTSRYSKQAVTADVKCPVCKRLFKKLGLELEKR